MRPQPFELLCIRFDCAVFDRRALEPPPAGRGRLVLRRTFHLRLHCSRYPGPGAFLAASAAQLALDQRRRKPDGRTRRNASGCPTATGRNARTRPREKATSGLFLWKCRDRTPGRGPTRGCWAATHSTSSSAYPNRSGASHVNARYSDRCRAMHLLGFTIKWLTAEPRAVIVGCIVLGTIACFASFGIIRRRQNRRRRCFLALHGARHCAHAESFSFR